MAPFIWIILIGGTAFMVWYGFSLLVKKPGVAADGIAPLAQCHLCRREFLENEMISREKAGGIIYFFCGDCIEGLYNDYVSSRGGAARAEVHLN